MVDSRIALENLRFAAIAKKTVALVSPRKRRRLWVLIFLSIVISLIEVAGISFIMPFVQVAIDFGQIHANPYFRSLYETLGFASDTVFVVFFGLCLILFYVARSLANVYYYYKISEFSKKYYHDLSMQIFGNVLRMRYKEFQDKNSSRIVQAVASEALNVSHILAALVTMTGEAAVVALIYGLMLFVDWQTTLYLTLFLAFNAALLKKTLTRTLKRSGARRAEAQKGFYELLNSSFGNLKFIKLRSQEEKTSRRFEKKSEALTRAFTLNETMAHIPRLYLETLSYVIVLLLVIYWVASSGTDVSDKMGLLSLFIIALYRMMPSFNRIITKYNQIVFLSPALEVVYEQLRHRPEKVEEVEEVPFRHSFRLEEIAFSYEPGKPVLQNVSFSIQKGEKVAFVGESGSGKSTMVDLIMGLLEPDRGAIRVDDTPLDGRSRKAWRRKFGYIPQDIYLFDASVAENVAFAPEEEVDRKRVKEVLEQAKLLRFLEEKMDGIDTMVGEKGMKLSGGQKQRIAIARALYHDPEILVLDEATSALDAETEKKIMREIYEIAREKTLLIVAHRLSTITSCETVYEVKEGRVFRHDTEHWIQSLRQGDRSK
ncbi:ABC transporter ATP-binding protein [Hydrogenimonas sp.]